MTGEALDAAADLLALLATDTFPAIEAATRGDDDGQSLFRQLQLEMSFGREHQIYQAVQTHPLFTSCVSAMESDPTLQILKPAPNGMQAFVMSSKGGSRMTIDAVPLALINAAATECIFAGGLLTKDLLREAALANLAGLRAALSGNGIGVRTVVGYAGVVMPSGSVARTPWGQLRPLTAPQWIVPRAIYGMPWGQQTATAVLVLDSEEELVVSHDAQPITPAPERQVEANQRNQRVTTELLPLALVLATSDDPLRPLPLWQMPIVSWSLGRSWTGWMTASNLRQRSSPLGPDDIREIERWSSLIKERYETEVAFVGRRVVSATSARLTAEDVLVDSVVAWENLVGGAPETTFRTSSAMAWLLEAEPTERLRLQRRLSAIYDARSDVVHGRLGNDVSQWRWRLEEGSEKVGLNEVAEESLQFAMRGLKVMIEKRPELMPLRPSERSRLLVMGA